MLEPLRNALRVGDLRKRLLFTLAMLLIYRVAAHVPVPGVDPEVISRLINSGTILGFLDVISGGALKSFAIAAMGIGPYINSSIIMQLLTIVIPALERLSKEGEEGRKKITQYIRYGTVVLGLVQAVGMYFLIRNNGAVLSPGFSSATIIAITLTAGTAFVMWLGEQITERGIGNGISILIFASIVSRLPIGMVNLVKYVQAGTINIFGVAALLVLGLGVIALVVMIQEGQRRIPVQYAKRVVGRRMYGGQTTHLPLKVNQAGVIPVIFASSIIVFPITIAQFFSGTGWANFILRVLDQRGAAYNILFALFIIFFTYFYTAVVFNPVEVSNNIKKHGGFIPGLRPGKPTADYLAKVLERITLSGAVFLAFIAILPNFILLITRIPNVYFGGTALLIVVGVALETMKQIEAHMLMRHYQGFMK